MIPIITQVHPATDTLPVRIIARLTEPGWGGKKWTTPWKHELNHEQNHYNAAMHLWAAHGRRGSFQYVGSGQIGHAKRTHLLRMISEEVTS